MIKRIEIKDFIQKIDNIPIVDVRSPKEYEFGHVVNALNIPLFDDDERAVVGTKYHKVNRESAIMSGLEIVGPKMVDYVKQAKKIAKNNELMIYCWRGGMRSGSLAWLFDVAGINVSVLIDGYKAYRKFVRDDFSKKAKVVILGGMTGSGKSDILHVMQDAGSQVLDLEGFANHKGSAFGSLGQDKQPSNEQFENNLFHIWKSFDLNKPVWIEGESASIGKVRVPETLFSQMKNGKLVEIEIDKSIRIQRLVKEYASFDIDDLKNIVLRIGKRLGGQNVQLALDALDNKDFAKVADISLTYYDKAYNYSLEKNHSNIYNLKLQEDNPIENSKKIIEFAKKEGVIE
ncbi:MAG: tRNA 2-selenouridine(34) synthase MnmH [Bacteroidetes bacterium]|nr:tRNA 2-selenouridine(34) synthase MnmH [Bacteroidota bacterium]